MCKDNKISTQDLQTLFVQLWSGAMWLTSIGRYMIFNKKDNIGLMYLLTNKSPCLIMRSAIKLCLSVCSSLLCLTGTANLSLSLSPCPWPL